MPFSDGGRLALVLIAALSIYVAEAACFHFTFHDEDIYLGEALCLTKFHILPKVYPLTPIVLSLVTLAPHSYWEIVGKAISIALTMGVIALCYREQGFLTSLFLALSPMWVLMSIHDMTEPLFTLTMLASFVSLRMFLGRPGLATGVALGISLWLCYMAKVSAIPFILGILAYLLARFAKRSFVLRALIPLAVSTSLIALWLCLEVSVYGRVATSLHYTLAFVGFNRIPANLGPRLLALAIVKALAGITLCFFPYAALALVECIRSRRIAVPLGIPREVRLGIALFAVTTVGYFFALSLGQGYPESVDHMARYLMPILPFVKVEGRNSWLAMVAILVASVALGLGLQLYASHHALNRVPWSEVPSSAYGLCLSMELSRVR